MIKTSMEQISNRPYSGLNKYAIIGKHLNNRLYDLKNRGSHQISKLSKYSMFHKEISQNKPLYSMRHYRVTFPLHVLMGRKTGESDILRLSLYKEEEEDEECEE